ncbi:hypothetical protein BROUX41_000119 [Berkeleyomyces rouxiae]
MPIISAAAHESLPTILFVFVLRARLQAPSLISPASQPDPAPTDVAMVQVSARSPLSSKRTRPLFSSQPGPDNMDPPVREVIKHRACDFCRTRKVACSKDLAGCVRCTRDKLFCVYSPQKQMGRPRKIRSTTPSPGPRHGDDAGPTAGPSPGAGPEVAFLPAPMSADAGATIDTSAATATPTDIPGTIPLLHVSPAPPHARHHSDSSASAFYQSPASFSPDSFGMASPSQSLVDNMFTTDAMASASSLYADASASAVHSPDASVPRGYGMHACDFFLFPGPDAPQPAAAMDGDACPPVVPAPAHPHEYTYPPTHTQPHTADISTPPTLSPTSLSPLPFASPNPVLLGINEPLCTCLSELSVATRTLHSWSPLLGSRSLSSSDFVAVMQTLRNCVEVALGVSSCFMCSPDPRVSPMQPFMYSLDMLGAGAGLPPLVETMLALSALVVAMCRIYAELQGLAEVGIDVAAGIAFASTTEDWVATGDWSLFWDQGFQETINTGLQQVAQKLEELMLAVEDHQSLGVIPGSDEEYLQDRCKQAMGHARRALQSVELAL